MNGLFNKLLSVEASKIEERETKVFYSKRLAKILGESEPVAITLTELPYSRISELMNFQLDKKGRFDVQRSTKVKALVASEGIIDPDLNDEKLIEHFGCRTAHELVMKIFSMELNEITDEILMLSGFATDDDDIEEEAEEIKN